MKKTFENDLTYRQVGCADCKMRVFEPAVRPLRHDEKEDIE